MKIVKGLILFMIMLVIFNQCKSDDGPELLDETEQNVLDDLAIQHYLAEHYFDPNGRVTKFNEESTDDDNETALIQLAEQHGDYFIVKNPNITADGRAVVENTQDSILIQYTLFGYRATRTNDTIRYGVPVGYFSTVHQTGYAQWDPTFYHVPRVGNVRPEQFEIPAIVQGIKHFNSTDRSALDEPAVNFQGIIIAPSRAAYGRRVNQMSVPFDTSIILNFELLKVMDRNTATD